MIGDITASARKHGEGAQAFADPSAVYAGFRIPYPGESGTRNPLRGDGYFGIDAGLNKTFAITERVRTQLKWEVFNVTNSVRFDVGSVSNRLDEPTEFGRYHGTLTNPRVMQFALRVEF